MPTVPRLLTVDEVAEALGVSRRSVQGWIAAGRIEVVRLSSRVLRVSAAEVARLVAEATVPATS